SDFVKEALPYYPNLRPEMIRVVLVHPEEFVLTELGQELGRYATRKLAERGIEIRSNTKIKAVTSNGVELTDGADITTRTLVWTAGISPHPLLQKVPLPKERQRLKVNGAMGVEGYPGIWALGDCAVIPDEHGGYQPPTATAETTLPNFRQDLGSSVYPLGVASPFFRSLPIKIPWLEPTAPCAHP